MSERNPPRFALPDPEDDFELREIEALCEEIQSGWEAMALRSMLPGLRDALNQHAEEMRRLGADDRDEELALMQERSK